MIRLLIDGYNLLHALGLVSRRGGRRALELSRSRLARQLAQRLPVELLAQTVVVFDASSTMRADNTFDEQSVVGTPGPHYRFAREYDNADRLIIELIAQHSAPRHLTVVSSDHEIQQAATRRRAIAVDSEQWFDSLSVQRKLTAAPVPQQSPPPTASETLSSDESPDTRPGSTRAPGGKLAKDDQLSDDDVRTWLDEFGL